MATARLELTHEMRDVAEICDGGRFGDLEAHGSGGEVMGAQLCNHILEEPLVVERGAGQIDRDGVGPDTRGRAVHDAVERLAHHPAIDGGHHIVAFRRRDELGRRDQRAALVAQAQQELEVLRLGDARTDRHDRLVEKLEASLIARPREPRHPVHLAMPLGHIVRLIELHAVAALILRGIARDVGGAHDARDRRRIRGDFHDANAHAHRQHATLPDEAVIADRLTQGIGDAQRLLERAIGEQNPELVAAEPGERIARAHARLQHAGDLPQQLIPGGVPAGIVDQFELIEIEIQEHVPAGGVLAHALDRAGQAVLEFTPVDQAGERIVARLVVERAVHAPLLAHVVEHHDGADQVSRAIAYRRGGVLDGNHVAAPRHEHRMLGESQHLAFAQAAHDGALGRLPRGLVHHGQDIADELRLRLAVLPSRQALRDRVHVVDAPFGIGGDDRIADRLQRDLRAFLRLEYRRLRLLARRDVGDRSLESDQAALLVAHRAAVVDHHEHAAVLAAQDVFLVAHLAVALHAPYIGVPITRIPVERSRRELIQLLRRGVAEHLHEGRIDDQQMAVPRRAIHPVHDALEQAAELGLAFPQGILAAPPLDRNAGDLTHARHEILIARRRQPGMAAVERDRADDLAAVRGVDGRRPGAA